MISETWNISTIKHGGWFFNEIPTCFQFFYYFNCSMQVIKDKFLCRLGTKYLPHHDLRSKWYKKLSSMTLM